MMWDVFIWFAAAAAFCWLSAAVLAFISKRPAVPAIVSISGTVIFLVFISAMWIMLGRPPMRTMGETRLWYSFFLSIVGVVIYLRYHYKWILSFGALMSVMFVCINLFKPEIHTKALMPALQSAWFVPHVIVYMFSYAILGAVTLLALYFWARNSSEPVTPEEMKICDTLVRIGWSFLTMGMVMGALWAKVAWGDYWTWDPKETWAAVTWLSYMFYLHSRPRIKRPAVAFAILFLSFLMLQMCWYGVNYLPSAQGASLHVY